MIFFSCNNLVSLAIYVVSALFFSNTHPEITKCGERLSSFYQHKTEKTSLSPEAFPVKSGKSLRKRGGNFYIFCLSGHVALSWQFSRLTKFPSSISSTFMGVVFRLSLVSSIQQNDGKFLLRGHRRKNNPFSYFIT